MLVSGLKKTDANIALFGGLVAKTGLSLHTGRTSQSSRKMKRSVSISGTNG